MAVLLVMLTGAAAPAHGKSYSADRFDSVVQVNADGTLAVTETVVFRFERGTFREVFREIPLRRTDAIEIMGAGMDGQPLPFGDEIGTVEVRNRRDRIRVVWRFSPVGEVTREFTLTYRVRGAIRQDPTADVLLWRGTPGQHQYAIRASTIDFELPIAPASPPEVQARRTTPPVVHTAGGRVTVRAADIRRNGWIETSLAFPPGSFAQEPPAWQQRRERIQAGAARWMAGAGLIVALGLLVLALARSGHDPPPKDLAFSGEHAHQAYPPEALDATLAGVLASNGQPALHHAIATLFSLADRGELEIEERRRAFGTREFLLTRRTGSPRLSGYERTALDMIFKEHAAPGTTVTLAQARSRLAHRLGRFGAAVRTELAAARLLDPARQSIRVRYTRLGVSLLIAAGAAAGLAAALLVQEHGAWPMLLPGAILAVAIVSFIFAAAVTPLSNEGVRRAARWRAYRAHLTAVARGQEPSPGLPPIEVLPFATALGLAAAWSKYLKQHGHPAPPWFQAARPEDAHAAFPVLIASGGAGASGGGGAGAGAGGGASGAG